MVKKISRLNLIDCDGEKIGVENSVKLACKQFSAPVFPSDGHPMLLDQLFGQEDKPSELMIVTAGKLVQKTASSSLVSSFLPFKKQQKGFCKEQDRKRYVYHKCKGFLVHLA